MATLPLAVMDLLMSDALTTTMFCSIALVSRMSTAM